MNSFITPLSPQVPPVTIHISVSLDANAIPEPTSIHMLPFENGTKADPHPAFQTTRRAILHCGSNGRAAELSDSRPRQLTLHFAPPR